jgi:hypothetical protein
VHLAWADNRDINPWVDFPGLPPLGTFFTGGFNLNIYADRLVVAP